MSIFNFWWSKPQPPTAKPKTEQAPLPVEPITKSIAPSNSNNALDIRRYFHNERGFQCYTTWFSHWNGWVSAGHCVTEALDHTPDFVTQDCISWPDGLDAALAGCKLPSAQPQAPQIGRSVILRGFPAGSRTIEEREGVIYFERSAGQWIAHIKNPDEPVVTGMSGGPVVDIETGEPLGIIITRNSPADLNNDRDLDESADFIALSAVWKALNKR